MFMDFRILCTDFLKQIFSEQQLKKNIDITIMFSWTTRHVLFLNYPNKLFEAKLFVNFTFFNLFYFLEIFTTVYVFYN